MTLSNKQVELLIHGIWHLGLKSKDVKEFLKKVFLIVGDMPKINKIKELAGEGLVK